MEQDGDVRRSAEVLRVRLRRLHLRRGRMRRGGARNEPLRSVRRREVAGNGGDAASEEVGGLLRVPRKADGVGGNFRRRRAEQRRVVRPRGRKVAPEGEHGARYEQAQRGGRQKQAVCRRE